MTDSTQTPVTSTGGKVGPPQTPYPERAGTPPAAGGGKRRSRSFWGDAARDLLRNPLFIGSAVVVLAVVSMAIWPGLWTNADPQACSVANARQAPSADHIFGRTVLGCDLYSHVIYGAQPSIVVAVVATAGTTLIGIVFGTLAAYYGGAVDTLISRFTDIIFGLPFILGALLFLSMAGNHSVWAITGILIALGWTQTTRIMRGSVMTTKNADYVQAARAVGASNSRIIRRHILPNAIAPAIVIATISLGGYVSAEATLTYLGVGLQQPEISWGILIAGGQRWALSGHPHLLIFPCAFLIVTVLAFILLGDALRDALDPRLR